MKNEILLEIAKVWEKESESNFCEDGSDSAKIGNAIARGNREAKKECADTLKMLVRTFQD